MPLSAMATRFASCQCQDCNGTSIYRSHCHCREIPWETSLCYSAWTQISQKLGLLITFFSFAQLFFEILHRAWQWCCLLNNWNECQCYGWTRFLENGDFQMDILYCTALLDWVSMPGSVLPLDSSNRLASEVTLISQIVEHTEMDEHLEEIAENLIVEHLFYTISIATNNRTSGIFFHCVNKRVWLWGTWE